jgi:hypothetical protein
VIYHQSISPSTGFRGWFATLPQKTACCDVADIFMVCQQRTADAQR